MAIKFTFLLLNLAKVQFLFLKVPMEGGSTGVGIIHKKTTTVFLLLPGVYMVSKIKCKNNNSSTYPMDAYYECVATRSHNNWRPEGRKQNYPALPIPVLPETTPGEIII